MKSLLILTVMLAASFAQASNNQIRICGETAPGRYDIMDVSVVKNLLLITQNLGGIIEKNVPKQITTSILNSSDLSQLSQTMKRQASNSFVSANRYDPLSLRLSNTVDAYIIATDRLGVKHLINLYGDGRLFLSYQVIGQSTSCK